MKSSIKVALVSNFGQPIRGVSPYSDSLFLALNKSATINIEKVDYQAAYPQSLQYSNTSKSSRSRIIHFLKFWTWKVEPSFNVIHIQYWTQFQSYYLLCLVRKAIKQSQKIVLTIHNPKPHENIQLFTYFENKLLTSVNAIIIHNEYGRSYLEEKLGRLCPEMFVIPHGIEIEVKDDICNEHEQIERLKTPYILFAGNIRPYKGLDILLDAWAVMDQPIKDEYDLIIAGRVWGKDQNILHRIVAKLLSFDTYAKIIMEKIRRTKGITSHLNFIENDHFLELLQNAKLIVLPYRSFSGNSGVIGKAIGFGTPVLVSDLPGLKLYTISEEYILKELSAKELASKINSILPRLNEVERNKQKERAQLYSWERVAQLHLPVYEYLDKI